MNMQANTCKYAGRTFRQTKQFGAQYLKKSPEIRQIVKPKYL